jgi:hypothetical protein
MHDKTFWAWQIVYSGPLDANRGNFDQTLAYLLYRCKEKIRRNRSRSTVLETGCLQVEMRTRENGDFVYQVYVTNGISITDEA